MKTTLIILKLLKTHIELKTEQMLGLSDEFDTRKMLSAKLGSMSIEGLIIKSNPGLWSLTSAGRATLDAQPVNHPSTTSQPTASREPEASSVAPDEALGVSTLKKLLPEGSSLVIQPEEVFFVFAGQQFGLNDENDLEAVLHAASLWVGKVA